MKTWPRDALEDRRRHRLGLDLATTPSSNLIYYGTGNPGPWNSDQRPGDNKWTVAASSRAIRTPARRVWFYQLTPARPVRLRRHQREHPARSADRRHSTRKVLRPPRPQRLPLRARPRHRRGAVGRCRSCTSPRRIGVDLKTGRPIENDRKKPRARARSSSDICPAAPGAKDWQPSAYSPRTGLLYIPHQNLCMDYEGVEANYIAGTPYVGANVRMYAGPRRQPRRVHRLGPGGAAARSGRSRRTSRSGAARSSTAGDVVFYGTMDGWFKAVDARTGELLWQFKTGSGIIGQPVTYRGPDGKQYVADPVAASAAGPARSSPASSTRATPPPRSASSTR